MRTWIVTALLAVLASAQDKPVYDKSWQEESIVVRRKDEKTGKEAAIIKVNFVKPHKISDCIGREFSDVLRDYPSARLFKGGSIRACFKTGDPYHVHILREDGSDLAIPAEGDVVAFTAEDLKPAKHLVAVSGRFDVSVKRPNEPESRLHLPPYVASVRLDEAADPMAEATAQSTAQVGGSVLADVRPFSDHEFALGVIHEGEAQSIEIGFGEHLLRPRMTFEGSIGNQQQHVGLYPMPAVARKSTGELNVGVGASIFKYRNFPHTRLELEFPTEVDALEATVKGTLASGLPLTALVFSGAMMREPSAFRASAIELGDKRELEAKIAGEAETFFFVRLWTGWKKRGGMLGCGMMEAGARGPYKYLVEPPPRPFYTIRMRGSRTGSEAGQILGSAPSALVPLLGSGLMGVGLATTLGQGADGLFGSGSGVADSGAPGTLSSAPTITALPSIYDPSTLTVADGASRVVAGGGDPAAPKGPEVFKLWVESGDTVNFPDTLVHTTSPKETIRVKYTYDDGDPNTLSWKKIIPPTVIDGVFHVSSQFPQLPEGKDLPFDVHATFSPNFPKQYVSVFGIQHDTKGVPVLDAKVTLKGRGRQPQPAPANPPEGPNPAFKLEIKHPNEFNMDKVVVGDTKVSANELLIEVFWNDGDPNRELRLEFDFETLDQSGGALKLLTPTGKRFYTGTPFGGIINFTPTRVGSTSCDLKFSCKVEGTAQILKTGTVHLHGEGINPEEGGGGGGGAPYAEVKIPSGGTFRPAAKYKVIIKDKTGYRIPTEDEKKRGCPPGSVIILTPKTSKGGTIIVNPTSEPIPDIPTVPARPLPIPPRTSGNQDTPKTLPPVQINPTEPYVFTTQIPPEEMEVPYVTTHGNNTTQEMEPIGTLDTPEGKTVVIYTARCAPEMAGSFWTIKDGSGGTIVQFETYYWAPAGPPEIDREQTGIMSFQRFGRGPAASVVIQTKNLSIINVDGDIKEVKLENSRATGQVPQGTPKVNVTFRSSNLEKEGEIDLVEPRKQ